MRAYARALLYITTCLAPCQGRKRKSFGIPVLGPAENSVVQMFGLVQSSILVCRAAAKSATPSKLAGDRQIAGLPGLGICPASLHWWAAVKASEHATTLPGVRAQGLQSRSCCLGSPSAGSAFLATRNLPSQSSAIPAAVKRQRDSRSQASGPLSWTSNTYWTLPR